MRWALAIVGLVSLMLAARAKAAITLLSQETWANVEAFEIADPTNHRSIFHTGTDHADAYVSLFHQAGYGGDYVSGWASTWTATEIAWDGRPVTSANGLARLSFSGGLPGTSAWQTNTSAGFRVQFSVDMPTTAFYMITDAGYDIALRNTTTGELFAAGSSPIILSAGLYDFTGEITLIGPVIQGQHDVIQVSGGVREISPAPEPSTAIIWGLIGALALCIGWRRRPTSS